MRTKIFYITLLCLIYGMAQTMLLAETASGNDDAIAALRAAALAEAATETKVEAQEVAFTSGALGLQALNPEISITGDILWKYLDSETSAEKSDFMLRGLGVHAEAYLDPYTRFKATFSVNEDETVLGEAYMTRFGILSGVNLTLGKFRQQFGVVNRWHKHGLDQVDFPLALRQIFGEGGLNQTGGSIDWTPADFLGFSHDLTAQITDGDNDRVFGENAENNPCSLIHYKVFRDLTLSTYAELGFSGLYGKNGEWLVDGETVDKKLDTWVFGMDLSVVWEPASKMRYRNLVWRSELYDLEKDIMASDGSGEDSISAWGLYSYLESKISRTVILGIRGDYFVPDTKSYADGESVQLSPLAVTASGADRWQVGPYVTWNQSPFVHFRAEYNHQDGSGTGPEENTFWLQCIFAAGPHKHERY